MLPLEKQEVKGSRKPVRVRHGPATVTGERTRRGHRRSGKAGLAESRESGDWPFARFPKPGRGPREGGIYGEDPRAETPFDPAAVELACSGSATLGAVRPPLGQRGLARTAPGAGRGHLRLPARVRPRRATPARRSLPLGPPVVSAYLRRGMAAGLLAGLLAGLFAFLVGEPILDRAIALEEASASAHHEEVFSRSTQKIGLFFATGLFGVTEGGVFGISYAYFRERLAAGSDFERSISLAGAIFAGAFLIPFLKYPANPPSVGDPATIRERTAAYFTLVALSLLAMLLAWLAARTLKTRGVDAARRRLMVGAGLVVVIGVLFLVLPDAPSAGGFPSGMLWAFRLSSFGTQLAFWAGLGLLFGVLCERARRKGVTT